MLCKQCEDVRFPDVSRPSFDRKKEKAPGGLTVTLPETPNNPHTKDQTAYCNLHCKYECKETKDMIRCCLCMNWYHTDCLAVKKINAKGFWCCTDCRIMPTTLLGVSIMMTTMQNGLEKVNVRWQSMSSIQTAVYQIYSIFMDSEILSKNQPDQKNESRSIIDLVITI